MDDERLTEIRARDLNSGAKRGQVYADRRDLIAEVDRQAEELATLRAEGEPRREAIDTARAYFLLLEQVPDADADELQRLRQEMERLLAPYDDNPAMVALLERKRAEVEMARARTKGDE